jgi:cell division protein FtsI (penicillin-binding protein 3)
VAPLTKKSGKNYSTLRFGWICGGILVCFFLLAFRVGYLQLLEHQQLADQADQRSIRTQVLPTNRGMITDRNGEALAVSVSSKDIVLDPKHILDTHTDIGNERWQSLANVLKMPLTEVQKLIQANAHKRFVYLARKVEDDNADYISKLRLNRRQYPAGLQPFLPDEPGCRRADRHCRAGQSGS